MLTQKQKLWESYVVPDFAELMIKQLAQHSERGDSWKGDEPFSLLDRAREELEEVAEALKFLDVAVAFDRREVQCKKVAKECADVANFMMMIADSIDSL